GMLHVHPWGTLSREALAKILDAENPPIRPAALIEELGPGGKVGELTPSECAFLAKLRDRHGAEVRYATLAPDEKKALRAMFVLATGRVTFRRFQATFILMDRLLEYDPRVDGAGMMYDDFLSRAKAERVTYVELSK